MGLGERDRLEGVKERLEEQKTSVTRLVASLANKNHQCCLALGERERLEREKERLEEQNTLVIRLVASLAIQNHQRRVAL